MNNTRKANIRFDMDNELHRKAWQLLQDRDKNRFSSYSQTVVQALIELLSEETIEIAAGGNNAEFMSEISETVERTVEKTIERTLPAFLAGYMTCAASFIPAGAESRHMPADVTDKIEDRDANAEAIDFDFLGLN